MRLPPFRIRTLMMAVGVLGIAGGIVGLLAGWSAPDVVVGLYALDGPDPPSSFNSIMWPGKKGLMWGVVLGAAGWVASCLITYLGWRPRMTTRRWMIAVAVVAALLGTARVKWLADSYAERAELFEDVAFFIRHEQGGDPPRERYFEHLAAKYRRAARRPWLPVPPDPPEPE